MQKCIIVLGMHRSGTSAMSGLINKLGITLGSKLMLPNEYNEKGYFENSYIVNANDNILQTLGSSWNDPFLLEEGWCQRPQLIPHRDAVKKIINREFSTNELFCIKDPRISILLPFWISLLQELNLELFFIIPLRHPLEVAESLKKRDGFSIQKGLLLWMNNMLSIESYSRPFRRSFFVFDDFLISPADTVQRIFNKFNINLPDAKSQIDAVAKELLDIKLKHHHISALNFNNIPSLIDRFKTTLFDLKNNDDIDENNLIAIDEIRDEYKRLISIFYNRDIRNVYLSLSERDAQINNLSQSLMETDRQIAVLNRTVAERDAQISRLNQVVAERDAQISRLNQVVAERDAQISSLNQVVVSYNEALKTIKEIRRSFSWRITAPMRFASSKIKNITGVIKLLPSIIRFGGGVADSVRKTWRVFSREGWNGVKRRILFVGGNQSAFVNSMIRTDLTSKAIDRNDYDEWVRRYDTLTDKLRAAMRDRINNFTRNPLISVVMPTYNPKPEWLFEAIESVRKQIYPHWELCIADDASTDKRIHQILENYARDDTRIKVMFREKNGHISAASNSALARANGEWIALLDHDDLLAEHALFWVADAINQNPDPCLIYSDEDKMDGSGRRFDPYFKCDWNADLFYSHNLICHLGVYRADLVKKLGRFREGYEGAQDYDLALRCIEHLKPQQIVHIPRVLYHWRSHPGSTAQAGSEKNYALLAGERALNDHFARVSVSAKAELLDFGMYRVRYNMLQPAPLVSLIIPTRNGLSLIKQSIESILARTTYQNYEIIIVDNNSDDPPTLEYFKSLSENDRIRVLRDEHPFNYSALNNAAVKSARGEIVGLLNNDLEVISAEWLSEMVSHALRPGVGAVGARLWYPDETLQHGGVIIGLGGVAGHAQKGLRRYQQGYFGRANLIQSFSAVTAACLVIKKIIYEEVGGLNEKDLSIAFNDIDFCLRVREAGYRNIWTPYAELYHHESASRGYEHTPERQKRFAKEVSYMKRHWGDILLRDPAYNPNLTLDHEDFSLAWPPRVQTSA